MARNLSKTTTIQGFILLASPLVFSPIIQLHEFILLNNIKLILEVFMLINNPFFFNKFQYLN